MKNNKVYLERELLSERNKFKNETDILNEVKAIFTQNDSDREQITDKLKQESSTKSNQFVFDLLQTDKIFHLDQIKTICIDHRLRFLDTSLFKNEIPEEAISKIRLLEKEHHTSIDGFKIIAPSKAFHLKNDDDPLLFAPIGNGYYYLIHQWGKEINIFRKILVYPVRNLWTFTVFCVLVSVLATMIMPENKLSRSVPLATIIVFLFAFKSVFAVLAYAIFMRGKNFNEAIWERKYYNN